MRRMTEFTSDCATKRILSILLTVVLVLSGLPTAALAEAVDEVQETAAGLESAESEIDAEQESTEEPQAPGESLPPVSVNEETTATEDGLSEETDSPEDAAPQANDTAESSQQDMDAAAGEMSDKGPQPEEVVIEPAEESVIDDASDGDAGASRPMRSSYDTDVEVDVDRASYAVAIGQTLVVKIKVTTYEPYVSGEHKYWGYFAYYSQGQWNQVNSWYIDGGVQEFTIRMSIHEWESTGTFLFAASVFPIDNFATGGSLCDRMFHVNILPEYFTVTFDAQGGTSPLTSMHATYGCEYGGLPVPTRTGYTFKGWYTLTSGGNLIDNSTIVSSASNHTLYAQWEAKQ